MGRKSKSPHQRNRVRIHHKIRLTKKKKILLWAGLILTTAASGNFLYRIFSDRPTVEVLATPVRVIEPYFGNLNRTLRLDGHIESKKMITVLPLASGVIDRIDVEAGDRVKRGQMLAKLNSQAYELQLAQAESAYLMSKSTFRRINQLYQKDAASRQDYDASKAQYEAYKSQYELALLQVNHTRVESPIEGIILVKHLNSGDLAAPERPLFTIGDLDELVVRSRIPEEYYETFLTMKESMQVLIRRNRDRGDPFGASIDQIAPYISAESRNFEVSCSIEGDLAVLRPGMSVYLEFVLEEVEGIYYLPYQTLLGDDVVWHLEDERPVALSALSDEEGFRFGGELLQVKKLIVPELFKNDQYFQIPDSASQLMYLIEGQHLVTDNQSVKVVR